jgi:peroxiredoxin
MFRRVLRAAQQATPAAEPLAPGTRAPGFSLAASTGDKVSLSGLLGRPVVLVFFPAAWSPVCRDQLALYNEILPLFQGYNAQVLALSVDGAWCQKAFADNRNLGFSLLADSEPKGAVAQAYGVYDAEKGLSRRALFVIDGSGIIRWSYVSPSNINPGADGILNALESL